MATTEELRAIAAQLAHPTGNIGKDIAKMMDDTNIGMTKHAIQSLKIIAGQQILEVGHGNAGHVQMLREQYPDIHYSGLELSLCMHEEAIANNKKAVEAGDVSFFQYNGVEFPFLSARFDGIFSVNTVYFWQDAPAFLASLASLVTAGGKIAITFADKSFMTTLPFTPYGFQLYDVQDVLALAAKAPLTYLHTYTASEKVKNKIGEWVERTFYTVVWQKI